jgi:hypothetical protein
MFILKDKPHSENSRKQAIGGNDIVCEHAREGVVTSL